MKRWVGRVVDMRQADCDVSRGPSRSHSHNLCRETRCCTQHALTRSRAHWQERERQREKRETKNIVIAICHPTAGMDCLPPLGKRLFDASPG